MIITVMIIIIMIIILIITISNNKNIIRSNYDENNYIVHNRKSTINMMKKQ